MNRFIQATESEFQHLHSRCAVACLVFGNERMPVGVHPGYSRVGLEIPPGSRSIRLLVDRGLSYSGSDPTIRSWIANGYVDFPDWGSFKNWVKGPLRNALTPTPPGVARQPPEADPICDARNLTDWASLRMPPQPRMPDAAQLFAGLTERVRGQAGVLKPIAEAAAHHLAKSRPRRPLSILMLGPSGVGKTLTAETLCVLLKNAGGGMGYLRIDMAEYQEPHRIAQLLGAPPGYVGHGQNSELVDTLRQSPRTIILLDEIEKAHPSIFTALMNALDAGRLSSPASDRGVHQVDCTQAMFFLTSNLRSTAIATELDRLDIQPGSAKADELIRLELLKAQLLPELVGRVTHCMAFQPLPQDARLEALALDIQSVAAEFGLRLHRIDPSVLSTLVSAGGQKFGMRTQSHLVERELGAVFAAAATTHGAGPLELRGPPYRCVPMPVGKGGRDEKQLPAGV